MQKLVSFQIIQVLLCMLLSLSLSAQGITTPRTPSPAATVSQTIGISTVNVKYSRPSVKEREVWGGIVPFGWSIQGFGSGAEAPWRAGANENTVIEFSHPANVEGQAVPAGKYGLFFVVNKENTGEIILSKDYRSWGNFFYDAKQDQLRAKIQLRDIPHTEMLTYDFINVQKSSAELVLNWEKKQFPVKIEFAVDEIVMANAAQELKGPLGFNWQGFSSAANYALQNNVNLDQALVWIDQALSQNKNFQTLQVKSGLLRKMEKIPEADKLNTESIAIATEGELNFYGYQLLNQGQHDKAIEMFVLNTKRFPKSANTWDSLGEGYAVKGDKKNAIINFKKSLTLNPSVGTKANSEKFLKQLGAM
jgi:hypothetical protein